jgi:Ca2+-binding RTX toxin-like protein
LNLVWHTYCHSTQTTGNHLAGNGLNNVITVSRRADTVWGNDTIYGSDGADSIMGGTGNDLLSGDAGIDTVMGEAGNDSLIGGAGDKPRMAASAMPPIPLAAA